MNRIENHADGNESKNSVANDYMKIFLTLGAVLAVLSIGIYIWPIKEEPCKSLAELLGAEIEDVKHVRCMELLTRPISKWSEDDAASEPEIYEWLKVQGNEILPWEWTDEARRKDQKGYQKSWRRIWKNRQSYCSKQCKDSQKEIKLLEREQLILATIYTHRTNQIARLQGIAATNTYPCRVSLERIEKGRFWGWNKHNEVIECENADKLNESKGGIIGEEIAKSQEEINSARDLSRRLASLKERLAFYESLREICDKNNGLIEQVSLDGQDEGLRESLVEILKGENK